MSRSLAVLAAAALAAPTASCIMIDDAASLTVHNHSSHVLTEIRLAELHDRGWGTDLLAGVLVPGADLLIADISCGRYDVLVVADTDVSCVLADLHLCGGHEHWVVDDVTLATCAY